MQNNKINSIQILRAIACILVIFFHYYGYYMYNKYNIAEANNIANNYFEFGRYGVQLFFLISGFIMYISIDNIQPSFKHGYTFILKRLIRIWPLYFIATVFLVHRINSHVIASVLFWPFKSMTPPSSASLGVGWTLSYEIYFYFLLSLCLIISRRVLFYLTLWFIITIFIIPMIYNKLTIHTFNFFQIIIGNYQIQSMYTLLNFISNSINLYFLTGLYIAFLYNKLKNHSPYINLILIISSSFIIYYITMYAFNISSSNYQKNINTILYNNGILIVLSSFLFSFIYYFRNFNFSSSLLLIGNMSYSLYLWQYFSLQLPKYFHILPSSMYYISLAFVFNLIISYISYQIIEKKLSNYLNNRLKKAIT